MPVVPDYHVHLLLDALVTSFSLDEPVNKEELLLFLVHALHMGLTEAEEVIKAAKELYDMHLYAGKPFAGKNYIH
jgi:hypothetical protein